MAGEEDWCREGPANQFYVIEGLNHVHCEIVSRITSERTCLKKKIGKFFFLLAKMKSIDGDEEEELFVDAEEVGCKDY